MWITGNGLAQMRGTTASKKKQKTNTIGKGVDCMIPPSSVIQFCTLPHWMSHKNCQNTWLSNES